MPRTRALTARSLTIVTLIAIALAGALVASATQPAQSQRKSIRWATASVVTYGYKAAASVATIIAAAPGADGEAASGHSAGPPRARPATRPVKWSRTASRC